jgi:hypothetical protein
MGNKLNASLIQKLRDLTDNIAISQRLNDDAKEELYSHLEDKALEYANDNEKLAEADILLLVREHFGNPENLNQFLGDLSNQKRTGLVDDILNCGWTRTSKDDFWGVFAFPWKQENRFPFMIYIFIGINLIVILPVILLLILHRPIPGWIYIFYPMLALIISSGVYLQYRIIGSKIEKKRKHLRSSVDMQTEGILVHGMLQSRQSFNISTSK